MTFNELLPVLKGNDTVVICDAVGEIVDCGNCQAEDPEGVCFEELTNLSRIIGDKTIVKVCQPRGFSGLEITIE